MSKFLIISENQRNALKESLESRGLPLDMQTAIISQETPLKGNPAISSTDYLMDAVSRLLVNAKEGIGEFNNVEELENEMSELSSKIKEIEAPIKNNLEVVCYNAVAKLFNAPEDCIDFNIEIVDRVKSGIASEPTEGDDYEYSGSEEMEEVDAEAKKRQLLMALCAGAACYYSQNLITDLDESLVSPEMKEMYNRFLNLNYLILCLKTNLDIKDDDERLLGVALLELGDEEKKNMLHVQAVNLPVLIFETIKGFMEIFAAHGLPKNKDIRNLVINRTDYLDAEPWNMRYGMGMWRDFVSMTSDESECIPEIFMKIAKLPVKKFNILMGKIFSGDDEARRIVSPLVSRLERTTFTKRMDDTRANRGLIADEYMSADDF